MTALKIIAAVIAGAVGGSAAAAEFIGPRVEAHLGWDDASLDDSLTGNDVNEDGLIYGIGVGYDFALSESVIAGVEANLDLFSNDYSATIPGIPGTTLSVDQKRDIEISARVGTKVSDSALLYGKFGYTNARVEATVSNSSATTSASSNADGLRLGLGLEYALTDTGFAKLEYRYSDYESGFTRNQLLAGVGFRF